MAKSLNVREVLSATNSRDRIAEMLPAAYRSQIDRFISRAALTFAQSKNRDKLLACSPGSIIQAVCVAAEYGFALDDKFCYAIPYGTTCTAMFDYKALIAVARRHKLILDVRAQDVCENDEFDAWEEDFKQRYRFRKASGDRGEIIGVFAVVDFPNGGHRYEHMAIEELNKVHAASKSPKSPAWVNWRSRMFAKAVVKRALLSVQDDPSLGSLIDHDNSEYDMDKIIDSTAKPRAIGDLTSQIMSEPEQKAIENKPVNTNPLGMSDEEMADIARQDAEYQG